MHGCYPDRVGRHKLSVPVVVVRRLFIPAWDRFVFPRRWPLVPLVGTGPPRTEPKGCVGRSGRESVMAVDQFCRNAVGPPEWECEAMGSVVWVKCVTSAECVCLNYR